MRSFSILALSALILHPVLSGCSDDDEPPEPRLGRRGESCRAANDCQAGLACISNRCVQNDFPIARVSGDCQLIECSIQGDCWQASSPSAVCQTLNQQCTADNVAACVQYLNDCLPDADCINSRCVSFQACLTDDDCFRGMCTSNNRCEFRCMSNEDCLGDRICVNGACLEGCETTEECPFFNQCQSGLCVETGCATDRECVAFTDNPLARCANQQCQTPCVSDSECNPNDYDFFGCEGGLCVYLGCQTDEECRIELSPAPGERAVCQMGGS